MKTLVSLFAVALMFAMVGCQTSSQAVTGADVVGNEVVYEATGTAIVTDNNMPQAKAAAAAIAKANLLEKLKGALISSSTTTSDLEFESAATKSMVRGWIARATVTYDMEQGPAAEMEEVTEVTATATLNLPAEAADMVEKNLKNYYE